MRTLEAFRRWEGARPFSEREAWNVFRLAAWAEAFGWTLLLSALAIHRFALPGHNIAIPIAGQVHGTIFVGYFCVLIATYSSLRWSRRTAIAAAVAGVPPYGTLMFEQIVARRRRRQQRRLDHRIVARVLITKGPKLLACQPSENTYWTLPGADVAAGQLPAKALARKVFALTGVHPKLSALRFVAQTNHHGQQTLELYFSVANSAAFAKLDLQKIAEQSNEHDAVGFVDPSQSTELRPTFLQSVPLEFNAAADVAFY